MAGKFKKVNQAHVNYAIERYAKGASLADIAKCINISRQAVWDLLKNRINLRPQKRFKKDNHFFRGGRPSSDWAHNIVEKAILSGKLIRPKKCQECNTTNKFKDGRAGIQAHHCDYNKPLEVMWLCQKCHHKWHKTNKAVERTHGLS